MKQKVKLMIPDSEEITDIQATFVALHNLLLEQLEKEPNKGIIIQKGRPNQYKLKWKKALYYLLMLEDYFILRDPKKGACVCKQCIHWSSVSTQSPHLGKCNKKQSMVHALHCCKGFKEYS